VHQPPPTLWGEQAVSQPLQSHAARDIAIRTPLSVRNPRAFGLGSDLVGTGRMTISTIGKRKRPGRHVL
jgi:hypothetical protein